MRRLTAADVERAQGLLRGHLAPTPTRRALHDAGDSPLHLKLECWQPTGSFKVRGAVARVQELPEATRRAGVVAASAGNHALGVAFAAGSWPGLEVTLFVPHSAPQAKLARLRRFPVDLRIEGADYDEAVAAAERHAQASGAFLLHAFDDPLVAAGQGSLAPEILDSVPDVGTIVVPVGGGGLISGVAAWVAERAPGVRVVAVQPEASPALAASLKAGSPALTYPAGPTLADGLAGGIGEMVWAHRELIHQVAIVPEAAIEEAIVALVRDDQVLAEASGAIAVAAIRAGLVEVAAGRPVVAIVTGANLDASVLARLLGRLTR